MKLGMIGQPALNAKKQQMDPDPFPTDMRWILTSLGDPDPYTAGNRMVGYCAVACR